MENDKELDHEYDGIKELDNPLPKWWLATFYGAIIFSVFYVAHYEYGSGPSHSEELAAGLLALRAGTETPKVVGFDEKQLLAIFKDDKRQKDGKAIYGEKCSSCHGSHGQGGIGPNLTDNYWIQQTGKLHEIATIVSTGVADKGMPPWQAILKPMELESVVVFVKSLQGSKPPNPKAPQGNEIK